MEFKKFYDYGLYKPYLKDLLKYRYEIETSKPFKCINPAHNDENPSMVFWKKDNRVHCFSCGAMYDIYDVIQILEEDVNDIKQAYALAEKLLGMLVLKNT